MSHYSEDLDLQHLKKLRKELWESSSKGFGQAAVMVGAGYSRNAKKNTPDAKDMPTWNQLGIEISRYLESNSNDKGNKANFEGKEFSGEEILKLSSEYRAVYGRQSLNELIIELISDKKYSPGKLHERLLSLPWADVFTTNFDTLLERTLKHLYKRNYDVVKRPDDIPRSSKPRIFKLHGTIPDTTPIIITEEDYRTYPKEYAPFVNAVQQSLMENLFCLVGFSANDPNFLYWTGWVRDNLGSSMKPIYLCGILNLSRSRKELLKQRNIVPIDLSKIFPSKKWPSKQERHKKATQWLLLYLKEGEPPEPKEWPASPKRAASEWESEDLPEIPSTESTYVPLTSIVPDISGELGDEQAENLIDKWKTKREEYPGWLVAPDASRRELWRQTEQWVEKVVGVIEELSPPKEIFLFFELNWRLETTLTPLLPKWATTLEHVLKTYNPFPDKLTIQSSEINPTIEKYKKWDKWGEIRNKWIELGFGLLRYYRERHEKSQFKKWSQRLNKIISKESRLQARWYYEKCLFNIFRFEVEKCESNLNEWPENENYLVWELRRASLYAEIGDLDKAENIAERTLDNTRTRLEPGSPDRYLLSIEGWTMFLLNSIDRGKFNIDPVKRKNYRDRWTTLQQFGCDPRSYRRSLTSKVDSPPPSSSSRTKIVQGFHPKKKRVTETSSTGPTISEYRPALGFLRMFEVGGIPVRCGYSIQNREAILQSIKWIKNISFYWAISYMVRIGPKNNKTSQEVDKWIDRVNIAMLDSSEIKNLATLCFSSLEESIDRVRQPVDNYPSLSRNIIKPVAKLLRKLCIRFEKEQQERMFSLSKKLYELPVIRKDPSLHSVVENLFEGLLYDGMSAEEITEKINSLLSLPIPNKGSFEVSQTSHWIEPMTFLLKRSEEFRSVKNLLSQDWKEEVSHLISMVDSKDDEARKRAIIRLAFLYQLGELTSSESESFGEALWSYTDENNGLPTSLPDGWLYSSILNLPDPKENATQILKELFISKSIPRQFNKVTVRQNPFIRALVQSSLPIQSVEKEERDNLIDWSPDEAEKLLEKTYKWWIEAQEELKKRRGLPFEFHLEEHLRGVTELLSKVIVPRLKAKDTKKMSKKVDDFISKLDNAGFCVLPILPSTLVINLNSQQKIKKKILEGLNSQNEQVIQDALEGLLNWLRINSNPNIPVQKPPEELITELIDRVVMRSQPGLIWAIQYASVILSEFPAFIEEGDIKRFVRALKFFDQETKLIDKNSWEELPKTSTPIKFEERPKYRRHIAQFAHQIYLYFEEKNKDIPKQVLKWKDISKNSNLPEIRRAWR